MSKTQEKRFDKYEKRGAYHWDWYKRNKNGYADKVDFVVAQLPKWGCALDIGGGDGLISYKLFEHGLEVTCIDTNAYSIKLAREQFQKQIYGAFPKKIFSSFASALGLQSKLAKRYEKDQAKFINASIFDVELQEPFDYIVCHEVIEHVPNPEALLAFISQHMRNFAIISTPDTTNRPQHKLDYHSWTPQTFAELLSDYEFEFLVKDGYSIYVKLFSEL